MKPARKLSFQEAWDSATVFYVDEYLEDEIDQKVVNLLNTSQRLADSQTTSRTVDDITHFLMTETYALDVILRDIGLSDEKFMRIVSLLRKLGRIAGGFESEWSINKIKRQLSQNALFTQSIASLLFDGHQDIELASYIPRFYLEKLNYREIGNLSPTTRKIRYKESTIGTYGGRKGYHVEAKIQKYLDEIEANYGIRYGKGRSRMISVDIDFAVPTVDDPQVIIMSSFQETTSSGQTTKTRDMLAAYNRVNEINSRYGENRAFINFVDGGGWLARKRDLERLVEQCHYFLNLAHLDMLETIVLRHIVKNRRQ